jgi:L-alanine-DL-glutamate epimerase-like enolase superfamily enzyme
VKLVSATLFALQIPFVESFRHSAKERAVADPVVVQLRDDAGTEGFGEGAPRPYVTGETVAFAMEHLRERLWPEVAGRELPSLSADGGLEALESWIPSPEVPGIVADHASRSALELAVFDCALRGRGLPAGHVLPPRRRKVVYSGVITAGALDTVVQHARRMKLIGLTQVKVKVGFDDDVARVRAVREVLGPGVSLRVDANGAWTMERAVEALAALAPLDVAAVEQPLPRGPSDELRRLREATSVPIMADESLVTVADARDLVERRAVDYFNVRVSKCGGLARSLRIARIGSAAGLGVQVGSQVGETAILSAAGRHLAAHLESVAFVEGSYGSLLLTEDVSADGVRFGHRGEADVLTGPGLGVRVIEDRLRKYAHTVVELSS